MEFHPHKVVDTLDYAAPKAPSTPPTQYPQVGGRHRTSIKPGQPEGPVPGSSPSSERVITWNSGTLLLLCVATVITASRDSERMETLQEQFNSLLKKKEPWKPYPPDAGPGFFSRIFVVLKSQERFIPS